jgi:ribosomal protein S18 acetylase RimI-like enzyme
MAFVQRPLSNVLDIHSMSALACQFSADNLHTIDLPYRLSSWALDEPHNVALWFDENQQLVAWAGLQTPFWTVDIVCCPAAEAALHAEILRWAVGRARETLHTPFGRPAWYVDVFSGQLNRIRDLVKAGFECQSAVGENSWSKVLMRRALETPVKIYVPPAGFNVRPLAGEKEVAAYVELHRAVFESKNMTVEWRGRVLRHPEYRPDLDIVVAAPDGRMGAFCVGWLDDKNHTGRVEPLGCHPDFRRYALGRVALSEGLRRLQSLGAQTIFVETDSYRNTAFALYEAFDFQVVQSVLVYKIEIN